MRKAMHDEELAEWLAKCSLTQQSKQKSNWPSYAVLIEDCLKRLQWHLVLPWGAMLWPTIEASVRGREYEFEVKHSDLKELPPTLRLLLIHCSSQKFLPRILQDFLANLHLLDHFLELGGLLSASLLCPGRKSKTIISVPFLAIKNLIRNVRQRFMIRSCSKFISCNSWMPFSRRTKLSRID